MLYTLYMMSFVIAGYFGASFIAATGFPPRGVATKGNLILLGMFALFALLPFAQKVEVAQFLLFEARPF